MKKLILLVSALLVSVGASANIGIVAGIATPSAGLNGISEDFKALSIDQYHAGVVYRIGLPLGFSVVPGLIYNMKGATLANNLEHEDVIHDFVIETKTGYLELPVQLRWGMDGSILGIFAFAEPFVGYAVNSETKALAVQDALQAVLGEFNDFHAGEGKWQSKNRLEYGAGFGAGIKVFKKIELTGKVFWNMGNLYNEKNDIAHPTIQSVYDTIKDHKSSGFVISTILYF